MDYQIKTSLPKSEVENRIAMNVDFRSSFSMFNYSDRFFYGKKVGGTFELKKVPTPLTRNSFAPVAKVSVSEEADGSTVHISTRLSIFTIIFLIIWTIPFVFIGLIVMPITLLFAALIMVVFYIIYRNGCNKIYEKISDIVS